MDEFIKYGLCLVGLIVLYKLYNVFKVFGQRLGTMKRGAVDGLKSGAQVGLVRANLEYMRKKIRKAAIEVYNEKKFNDFDKITEIENEFRDYVFSLTFERAGEVLSDDELALITRSGGSFENFIENPMISADIKSGVVLKTAGLRKSILKNELVQYVQENYGVNIESVLLKDK